MSLNQANSMQAGGAESCRGYSAFICFDLLPPMETAQETEQLQEAATFD